MARRVERSLGRSALLAAEEGTVFKEAANRLALVYPSPYRAAMSSLGYQSLYREVNEDQDWAADRAMLPDDPQSAHDLRTLETDRPVQSYPLLAFSVAYELELAGVVDCLDLMGLPVLAKDRGPDLPLVMAGGPLTFSNPVPMAPFFDLIIVGEGEQAFARLRALCLETGFHKEKILEEAAALEGFYVPSRSQAELPKVAKVDRSCLPARSQIITPHTELRSMYLTEVARGCSRGCTYCVMRRTTNGGMRAIDAETVLSFMPANAKRVGLVGAAVTDHPDISTIVESLVARDLEIGISSLRADKLTDPFVGLLAKGGYRTLTVALDAPSERMRRGIERATREEHVLRCAELVAKHRLHTLKLYMIVGLPDEQEEDIDELIDFAHRLSKVHHRVALGIAPFVAKRHTPLDGSAFFGISAIESRLKRLRKGLKGRVQIRPTSARWAWVEYMLAQGDQKAGLALLEAHRAGGRFADYKRAFANQGCAPTGPRARVLSSAEIRAKKKAELQNRLQVLA